jgi:Protein of unknown function (DUF1569)
MTPGRRSLSFASLDQVMPDVDRLLLGHTTLGKWSLGQVCNHLVINLTDSVQGYSFKAPWILRKMIAPIIFRKIVKEGAMREGVKVPAAILPKPDVDARAEAEALRAALRLFSAHTGPWPEHPFFGRLTTEQWRRLHCIHCAHHLSFVVPAAASG